MPAQDAAGLGSKPRQPRLLTTVPLNVTDQSSSVPTCIVDGVIYPMSLSSTRLWTPQGQRSCLRCHCGSCLSHPAPGTASNSRRTCFPTFPKGTMSQLNAAHFERKSKLHTRAPHSSCPLLPTPLSSTRALSPCHPQCSLPLP